MRSAEQVLDLFACYAEAQTPLSLSELARRLEMAPSTCFNMVRTFETRGFMYATGRRRSLYPTKRMLALAQDIARHDPVGSEVVRSLSALRDRAGETVVLATRTRALVTYLEVFESPQRIRYSAHVGETRPIQHNSMGKALLSLLPAGERHALVERARFEHLTDRTLRSAADYLADIERSTERGWFVNDGESVSDVVAVATPLQVHDSTYAFAIAGPRHRMGQSIDAFAALLTAARDQIEGCAAP